jgi:hypothetical protein
MIQSLPSAGRQYVSNHLTTDIFDDGVVVRRTIGSEKIFEHVDGYVRALLYQLGQVLPDDLAGEVAIEEVVKVPVDRGSFRSHL